MGIKNDIINKLYELKCENFRRTKIYQYTYRQKCVICKKYNTLNMFVKNNSHIDLDKDYNIKPICTFCEEKFNNIDRIVKLNRINEF